MSQPNTLLAYADCIERYEQALADPKGIRIPVKDLDQGTFLRSRLHYCRALDRRKNSETCNPGDPLFGRSAYDPFVIRIKHEGAQVYLYIEPVGVMMPEAEPLSEVEDRAQALPKPETRALPPPVRHIPNAALQLLPPDPIKRRV